MKWGRISDNWREVERKCKNRNGKSVKQKQKKKKELNNESKA